ncbi:hypothetical protein GCM10028822_34290 [Hymenobacter terrigena]
MLNRDEVFRRTNNGRDVFWHYFGQEPKAGRNFQNPFVGKQQTPSFNLYPNEAGEWRYKDFATQDEGSWLDFVMNLHELNMPEALIRIVQDLGLTDGVHYEAKEPQPSVVAHRNTARLFHATYRAFTGEELGYWQQYGIGPGILGKYGVRAVEQYNGTRANQTAYTITARTNNPIFAYDIGEGFVKMYAPYAANKAYKFTWPTGQPTGYVFGLTELSSRQSVILLAAGEKDAMALSAHGYAAVTVGSENVLIRPELVTELKRRCDELLICYDADETGRRRAVELAEEHGLRWVEWPAELLPYGKDAADFFRAVHRQELSPDLLRHAIDNARSPLPEASVIDEQQAVEHTLPTFALDAYEQLPDFLRRACAPFEGHEKAVMLMSLLGILSGCFSGVGGYYDQRRFGLNLFTFVIAPAASGKGVMSFAQRVARPYHKKLLHKSNEARTAYEAEWQAYNAAGKGKAIPPSSTPPPHQMLYLPGDTTAAALMQALADNDGRGIICETEADTLTSAMGGEHGKFGDKLCKMFQHEPTPLMRKGDKLYLELERPTVSIALTGTPGQLPRLMPNAENGLTSRFLFYSFFQPHIWRSGAPNGRRPLEPYFDEMGEELIRMIEATPTLDEMGTGGVNITLSEADWNRLDVAGQAGLLEAVEAAADAGASSAYRLGLIAFRVIGLLTTLRCYEHGEVPSGQMQADAQDVTTALHIMEVARAHALHVLATLPATKSARPVGKHMQKAGLVAQAVSMKREGMSVRQIGKSLNVPHSTVQDWFKAEAA